MTIITAIFIAGCFASLAYSYMQIAASVQRALNARFRGHAWILVGFLALMWPLALPALAIRDLLVHGHSHALLMGKKAWRDAIWSQERENLRDEEDEIRRVHAEWQRRVNYFYALGVEAEQTHDATMINCVADNLDFLLETEPPRPPEKVKAKAKHVAKKPILDQEKLRARIERKAEVFLREAQSPREDRLGFCNVCASQLERSRFQRYLVAGICDTCYDDTHEGTM
jgi:hypothetical protein